MLIKALPGCLKTCQAPYVVPRGMLTPIGIIITLGP